MKKTPKKIVEIATYMRNTGNFSLDIRYLTANEIGLIKAMISNDAVFESFVMLQDMDVRDIKIIFDYLTAKDNFEKAGIMQHSICKVGFDADVDVVLNTNIVATSE